MGKIEGEITPTGRLALAAGNGCKLVGLLAPTPNIKGKFKGVANLTQCPDKLLNRTYNVDAFDIKGNLKLTASTKEIVASKIRATYDISTTLVRR